MLSRWRTDLLVSLHEDAATFRGRALVVFGVLTLVAVAYPIIAQLVHAYIGPQPRTIDALSSAMKPYFVIVFAESLPFMIAVAGIGAFSPALGVLLMVIFIPADLAAASVGEWHQLKTHPSLDPFPAGIAARLITYGVLWILAVEIPLVVRRWVAGFAAARSVAPSRAMRAAATAGATAVLVFLWASALPWLIQPVFTWTLQQQISYEATVPTWLYWPILVAGAAFIAGVAAVWPTPARMPPHSRSALGAWHAGPRTMGQVIIRQIVVALALAALFAGLITDRRKAAILIGGLLVAGPVVTLLLPHVRLPRFFPPARSLGRWITAMGISLAISWLILLRFENTTTRDFLVTVITLARGRTHLPPPVGGSRGSTQCGRRTGAASRTATGGYRVDHRVARAGSVAGLSAAGVGRQLLRGGGGVCESGILVEPRDDWRGAGVGRRGAGKDHGVRLLARWLPMDVQDSVGQRRC